MGIEEEYNDDDLILVTVSEDLHELVTNDFDLRNTDDVDNNRSSSPNEDVHVDFKLESSQSNQSSESESESEAVDIHSRAGIPFTELIPHRHRRRNILTQSHCALIQPATA